MSRVNISISTIRSCSMAMTGVILCLSLGRAVAQQQSPQRRIRAEVVKPIKRPLIRKLRLPATLIADEQVDLYAKTSGYVDQIHVDIGSRVQKGDVLTTISIPEMMDELKQIQAVLQAKQAGVRALTAQATQAQRTIDIARSEVQRYEAQYTLDATNLRRKQELREGNAIPEQALDEAQSRAAVSKARLRIAKAKVAGAEAAYQAMIARVEVAESEVQIAQANLGRLKTLMDYASIKAPFDGVITDRQIDHGTFVRSAAEGTALSLLSIANTDRIRVVLEIPEIDVPFVRTGTSVYVHIKALGDNPLPGNVSRIAVALKPETRTMRAEVDLDNTEGVIAPGMYADIIAVNDNPLDDIAELEDVDFVMKGGVVYKNK